MTKRITTTATVAYILDPDLAMPDVIDRSLAAKFGIKNKGTPISFKNKKGVIKARGPYKKEKTDALNLIIDELAPFIDLVRIPGLASEEIVKNSNVFVKEEITTSEYSTLNSFGKQLYIKATESLYDRFPVGSEYAGLAVPPPGRFGKVSEMEVRDSVIKVRGYTSKLMKGIRRLLVRLTDGSLLEFYTIGSTLTSNRIESFFNKIIIQEPVILKKFIISKALTNELGRPAYKIDIAINVLEGNEKLSTVPTYKEEVEYYYQDVPIELSESSVLNLPSDFPSTLFYKGGTLAVENEFKKQFNLMVMKYSPLTRKSERHKIAFVALAKLNSTTASRYFKNASLGGSDKDLINPAVLETILDEYIDGKDRSNYIKVAIELLAGEEKVATTTLSGYCSNSLPTGSELGLASSQQTRMTPIQMLEKGKELLVKYLPDVFG